MDVGEWNSAFMAYTKPEHHSFAHFTTDDFWHTDCRAAARFQGLGQRKQSQRVIHKEEVFIGKVLFSTSQLFIFDTILFMKDFTA